MSGSNRMNSCADAIWLFSEMNSKAVGLISRKEHAEVDGDGPRHEVEEHVVIEVALLDANWKLVREVANGLPGAASEGDVRVLRGREAGFLVMAK